MAEKNANFLTISLLTFNIAIRSRIISNLNNCKVRTYDNMLVDFRLEFFFFKSSVIFTANHIYSPFVFSSIQFKTLFATSLQPF